VVRRAQEIVPSIEAAENSIEGTVDSISLESFWRQIFGAKVAEDQYVLSRTTAPLVSKCLETIRNGRKAFVRGRDIGKALFHTIDKIAEKAGSNRIENFLAALTDYRVEQIDRLTKTNRGSEAIAVGDRCDTLEALSTECSVTGDLERVINNIFSDDSKEGIEFSTIHKAKGREKPNVYMIAPHLLPHPKSPQHLLQIESNLEYVCITRAQENLFTVLEPKVK
jgi:superfamily I DNA/RNA helicase